MHRLKHLVFHPFVFATIPVVIGLDQAKAQILPEHALPMLVMVECFVVLCFLLAWLILKDIIRAGFVSFTILLIAFSYTGFEAVFTKLGLQVPPWVPLSLVLLLGLAAVGAVLKTKWNFGKNSIAVDSIKMNSVLNVVSLILFAFNLVPLTIYEVQDYMAGQKWVEHFAKELGPTTFKEPIAKKPDVYYFIVDACANPETLKELGKYDNYKFTDFLKHKGFYVVPEAASNYDRTSLSISSSMNMQYINAIPDTLGTEYPGETLYSRLVQDSTVVRTFKKLGYKFINISSGAFATDSMATADLNLRADWGNFFSTALLTMTPLWGTENYFPLLRDQFANRHTYVGAELEKVANMPGPKFVLVHTQITHSPAVFDAQGNKFPLPKTLMNSQFPFPIYVEQLKYAETLIQKWVSQLLNRPGDKPIIIIQSDHGPYDPMPNERAYFNEVMRILNAYYFPDMEKNGLYKSITPVNSFRVLFNDYFGANFKILPDRSYCSPIRVNPYHWRDVHPELQFNTSEPKTSLNEN